MTGTLENLDLHVASVKNILQLWLEYFTVIIKWIFALDDINMALLIEEFVFLLLDRAALSFSQHLE